jgi:hypothetical protein
MTTYRIEFSGRPKGAIGVFSSYTETVEADSKETAILELYETYEHIHGPVVTKCEENP